MHSSRILQFYREPVVQINSTVAHKDLNVVLEMFVSIQSTQKSQFQLLIFIEYSFNICQVNTISRSNLMYSFDFGINQS